MAADFPLTPPIEPMLAKLTETLPDEAGYLFEPKWDGFRAMVFRSADDVFIQSRDLRPFDRYFPDVHDACVRALPRPCVLDGEIVIATPRGLDFDALQMRLHPAQSRVTKLARETPSSFVAFDLLAAGGKNPATGTQVMDAAKVPGVLAVMATAGLYDDSGKWLYHTGLPAKSGVGGGLIAVSPGKFGIAVISPPLDDAGNSVRGQKAITEISNALGGNPLAPKTK